MATSAEYNLGEYPFPRGWFAVASSTEVGRSPLSLRYFGRDLVLYRGASGRPVLLDAYCPHMGTHLGSGPNSATSTSPTYMEEDNIRCPFHAWRFGADGVCNHIPYHDGPIPPAARVRTWALQERYGAIFCWHDPEDLEPDFDLPEFPEWDDPEWIRWEALDQLCDLNHQIEIFDNMSDVRHLDHLHGSRVVCYENEVEGHVLHQRHVAATDPSPSGHFTDGMTVLAGYVGPGVGFGRFLDLGMRQILCMTPIEDGTCRLWQAVLWKRPPGMSDEQARTSHRVLSDQMGNGLLRDGEVWAVKKPALQVMQMPGDGPFRQSRTWYSQFYNPRAKAAEIVARVAGVHTAKGMPAYDPSMGKTGMQAAE